MPVRPLTRRDFLASGLVTLGATLAGPSLWRHALAAPASVGEGPYGPLLDADANGLRLPTGFTSRLLARAGETVAGTSYTWHPNPDGGATFATSEGGWIYVSNSEVSAGNGGAGALRFDASGTVVDAYGILDATTRNCAGGPTPWQTWLSCEEHGTGYTWECDPFGRTPAVRLDALGVFTHEAAAVDPVGRLVYQTEDHRDGRLYRFTPDRYPDLTAGRLDVAVVADMPAVEAGATSAVSWRAVPDPSAASTPTREQVPGSTRFRRGEGCWYDDGIVYFTTTSDHRVWAYDTAAASIELLYDDSLTPDPILHGPDNVTVSNRSRDVFVAEDGGDLDIVMITPSRTMARLLSARGDIHRGSELTGPALNPAGDGFYFSSQRAYGGPGATYEIRGPFRTSGPVALEPTQIPAPPPSGGSRIGARLAGVAAALAAGGAAVWRRRGRGVSPPAPPG